MTRQFHADGPPSKRYAATGRLLLLVLGIAAFNVWLGWATWSIVGMLLFGLTLTGFSVFVRSMWGDSLEVLADAITVYKQGAAYQHIPVSEITSLTIKPASIAVQWRQEGKKKFIVIGSEHFSDPTWEQLSAAMKPLYCGR